MGSKKTDIYTDHQPLSFSISQKNPNIEIKDGILLLKAIHPK